MIEVGTVKVRNTVVSKKRSKMRNLSLTIPKNVQIFLGNLRGKKARVFVDQEKKRIIYEILDSSDKEKRR